MTDRQENKFTMYEAVASLLDANTAKTSSMTAFATALGNFKDTMDAISEKNFRRTLQPQVKPRLKTSSRHS